MNYADLFRATLPETVLEIAALLVIVVDLGIPAQGRDSNTRRRRQRLSALPAASLRSVGSLCRRPGFSVWQ